MLGLVPLANRAAMDEVADEVVCVRVVEGCAQPMQHLLGTLMTGVMGFVEKLWPEGGSIRHKDAPLVQQQPINQSAQTSGAAPASSWSRRARARASPYSLAFRAS